jgi:acyl-CoA synthetase (AMP-forming)/AMP-acid ligase II
MGTIVGDWPRINAERRLDGPWVVDATGGRTWAELDGRVNALGHALIAMPDHHAGRRLGILADNCTEHLELMFAASRIGCIHTALNTRHTAAEMLAQIEDSGLEVLLVGAPYVDVAEELRALRPNVRYVGLAGADLGKGYEELLRSASRQPIESHGDVDAVYSLVYTSGSTGEPKGVMVSSRNETAYGQSVAWVAELRASDKVLNVAPLFHRGGQFFSMTCAQYGVPLVIARSADPKSLLDDISREQVTTTLVVPTILKGIVEAIEADPERIQDINSIRHMICGSAPLPPDLARRFLNLAGPRLCQAAGMSEGALTMAMTPDDYAAILADDRLEHRLASVGRPNPAFRVAIAGEDGEPLPGEGVGEILYQGDAFVTGYWQRPEASAHAWRGGWFHSGDVGRRDSDGYLYYVDRLFGRIKTGAETVYAREVEQILDAFPGVAELAVVGLPDAHWGEAVTAVVVPTDGGLHEAGRVAMEDDLRAFGRERGLSGYKLPKRVVLVGALPKTSTNKIAYGEVRTLATTLWDARPVSDA